MPLAFMLAMQASGMVVDYLGTRQQEAFGRYGARLNQASIESEIEQTRLETEDASVEALKQLRQTMGTQLAVFAARGTNPGQGNAALLINEDIGSFNSDQQTRKLNQLYRENTIRGGGLISKLNEESANANLWKGFAQRTFGRIPIGGLAKQFGLTQLGGS
jgi:hypothetical protein